MTPHQSSEGLRRDSICAQAQALLDAEVSLTAAAKALGVPVPTLHRWMRAYQAGGFAALTPKQAEASGAKAVRDTWVEQLGEDVVQGIEKKVAGLALDVDSSITGTRAPLSDGLAWRHIARQPETPQVIRDYFADGARRSKHTIAESLRVNTRPGPMAAARHRGGRAYGLKGPWQPRELDIFPGDVFSSDDTTPIWAWWVPWPKSDKYPFGAKLLQGQFLPVIDVASQHILCYALIAREQSSYRATDIWRLMSRVHGLVGLPRLGWQKERGSWEATIIDGAKLDLEKHEPEHVQRVGGLRMLPSNLLAAHVARLGIERAAQWQTLRTFTSYLPKSKSVEGIFHRLQKFEGTLWGSLGRSQQRNPFERAKKLYEACRAGKADPRLNFQSGDMLLHRLNACIEAHEAERLEGEVFRGVPPQVWEAGIREHGALLPHPPEGRWLMCSDWGLETVSRGMARVRRTDEASGVTVSYYYTHPEFCGALDGRQVLVYFNRDEFEQPANILVPSRSGGVAEYLGQAEYVERKGMFLDGDIDGYELRRRQSGIVTTLYSDLAAVIPSRQLPAEIAQRRAAGTAVETRMPGGDFTRMERPRQAEPEAWDEAAELARLNRFEDEARERGELIGSD